VLLDRRKVKFWQRIIFGFMALLMVLFLVGYAGFRFTGCGSTTTTANKLDDEIAALQKKVEALPDDLAARLALAEGLRRRAGQEVEDQAQRDDYLLAAADAYKAYIRRLAKTEGTKAEVREAERLQVAALEELVRIYQTMGDLEAVQQVYGQLTDLRPKDAEYFYNMGRVAITAGDTNTALLAFARYLELEPDSDEAAQVQEWMDANATGETGQ
jgi:tetratricopeptide (TPR) repeat protein